MSNRFRSLIQSATQLTRAGLLHQATAAIQEALKGKAAGSDRGGEQAVARGGNVYEMERAALREPVSSADAAARPHAEHIPVADQFLEGSFTAHGLTKKYKLFVPGNLPAEGMPLVVMLHGCTQDPDDFALGTQMNMQAAANGFVVLYPAQGRDANPNRCWNWFSVSDQGRGKGEPGLIADMAQAIVEEYALDAGRVYVAGLSAGGAMAAILAETYPDIFAAAGIHSGLPAQAAGNMMAALAVMRNGKSESGPDRGTIARPIPMIVFHGDADSTVNPQNGHALVARQLHRAGKAGTYDGRPATTEAASADGGASFKVSRYVDTNGAPLVEFWEVHGAGHAWMGGSDQGSYTDAHGPDASAKMVEFFLRRRPAAS
ncbi:MAG: esterase, depolymerase family protein [Betaproteobacteria bacterium]|nr:esterase, depolymerase family protein [Betaproteobacteria bacterium]